MENKTWSFVDKSNWAEGPWKHEPDKAQWVDEKTGLACLAVRQSSLGHWCGYVGVNRHHPYFKQGYDDVPVDCHGGLTFADLCSGDTHGICHVVEPGEDEQIWWLGFDCAHFQDRSPGMDTPMRELGCPNYDDHHKVDHYWTLLEVQAECAQIADQLSAYIVAP